MQWWWLLWWCSQRSTAGSVFVVILMWRCGLLLQRRPAIWKGRSVNIWKVVETKCEKTVSNPIEICHLDRFLQRVINIQSVWYFTRNSRVIANGSNAARIVLRKRCGEVRRRCIRGAEEGAVGFCLASITLTKRFPPLRRPGQQHQHCQQHQHWHQHQHCQQHQQVHAQ